MSSLPTDLSTELFTIGVEEEYQIIDPETRQLCARSHHLSSLAQKLSNPLAVQLEFRQSQIETATPICHSLADVRTHLAQARRFLIAAADRAGCQLAAAGTHPFAHWQEQPITPKSSYVKLATHYQGLMHELVTFGCHIHIGIRDREMAIQVMNRVRPWLHPLLALSASSPFWLGQDTHYASYRTLLIRRLPMTGPPQLFASYQDYQSVVQTLLATQTIHTRTQICWDVRPSERLPTLEFRLPDMPLTVDETVMLAGLVRGLVRTCYEQARADRPFPLVRPELLEAAQWRAARWGLTGELVDVETQTNAPAHQVIEKLLTFVRPALEVSGEWAEIAAIAHQVMHHGNGAMRQRQHYAEHGSLIAVVDYLVQEMQRGLPANSPAALTPAIAPHPPENNPLKSVLPSPA